ncbi:MAG: hypothetical protein R3215_16695, partial [Halomonas sp.]|nr:hypothetical protein [Halomonas sp.]
MNHALILPILLPLITGASQLLLYRLPFGVQRLVGLASTLGLVGLGAWALVAASGGEYRLYHAGDWPAPFG